MLLAQTFKSPPGGTPPDTSGGGVRGGGVRTTPSIIVPLIPTDPNTNSLWGQTLSATPAFFLYLPAGVDRTIKFSVVDEAEGDTLYETVLIPPSSGGIVSIALPNTPGKTLKEGKFYSWYFELQGSPDQSSNNPAVSGFVQRIAPTPELSSKLQAATTDSDRAQIYADNGIWYELVATAATLRTTSPGNWEALLTSVGLGEIAQAPLITPSSNVTDSNLPGVNDRPSSN
jgi:hypothetical protein